MKSKQMVVCYLCNDAKLLDELSRNADGHLTNVCLVCRQKELQAILMQIEAILGTIDKPAERTQEVRLTILECGHVADCWCKTCHICTDGLCIKSYAANTN